MHPCGKIAEAVKGLDARVIISCAGQVFDVDPEFPAMSLLQASAILGREPGMSLNIECEGPHASMALLKLKETFADGCFQGSLFEIGMDDPQVNDLSYACTRTVPSLEAALRAGGIHRGIKGTDKQSVFQSIMEVLPLPEGEDKQRTLDDLLARESISSTGLLNGFAYPHVRRYNRMFPPQVSLFFLECRLDFGAFDDEPVHTMFVLLCPSTSSHIAILSVICPWVAGNYTHLGKHIPISNKALVNKGTPAELLAEARQVDLTLAIASDASDRPKHNT